MLRTLLKTQKGQSYLATLYVDVIGVTRSQLWCVPLNQKRDVLFAFGWLWPPTVPRPLHPDHQANVDLAARIR